MLLAEATPVATADSYYPLELAAGTTLEHPNRIEGGAHAYLVDELGMKLSHFTEEFRAREPTATEIETLQLRSGECVIRLLRTLYDQHRQAVQVSDHRLAGDKYVLLYEKGIEVSDDQLAAVGITRDEFHGEWNYAITPSETKS